VLTNKEGELLRAHLLRLDAASRHDRFNGFVDDEFLGRYAARSIKDGTVIVAYLEDGQVRGAAELHQPDLTPGSLAEIAFSVEHGWRRKGLGAILFTRLIEKARALGYTKLRITTGADNDAMRALARKFGAHLTFRHGESTGIIMLEKLPKPSPAQQTLDAWHGVGQAWLKAAMSVYGPRHS
jgi:GNAT superfamily N-acetyltransferase